MWGNEEQTESTEPTAKGTLDSVNALSDIDQKFGDIYSNTISNLSGNNLYSAKIQSIEIEELSKSMRKKEKIETTLDDDTLDVLNASNNDILGNANDLSIPNERRKRYQHYEEVPNINYIAHRMLKVYVDNILNKNVQNKQFININTNQNNLNFLNSNKQDIGENYKKFLKTFIVYFSIQHKLKSKIVPEMLKYGNSYVEVVNLEKMFNTNIRKELITETTLQRTPIGMCYFESSYKSKDNELVEEGELDIDTVDSIDKQFKDLLCSKELIQENEYDMFNDLTSEQSEYKFDDIGDLDFKCLKDIYLKITNPNKVIMVEQDGILFGYLVVEEDEDLQGIEIDVFKRFTQQESSKGGKDVQKEIIDNMTKGVINKLNERLRENNDSIKDLDLSESVESSIKIILYHKLKENSKLKFRFLSPNQLINFSTNIDKYAPYGTSIYDPILQPVKMYNLALMSSIVSRLSRASVVRKWTIEAGNKKNHAEIVEKVKADIKNKSISFDSLSNIKNIPNVLTDFRDIATIQVNGQRFIDMEIVPMSDRSLPLNDLNDLRNELIAATGIPSVYLNIGDQADLRETLVNLNTSFANNISSLQSGIDDAMNQLSNSVFNIVLKNNGYESNDFVISNYYYLSLNPPLVLTVQANEALINSITNIIGMLKSAEVVVDPLEIYKMYLPSMDWDALIKSGTRFIKKQAKNTLISQQGGQSY
ncbi:MAG: hypothetical protein WC136_00815 [Sphaerochaeta sp.]